SARVLQADSGCRVSLVAIVRTSLAGRICPPWASRNADTALCGPARHLTNQRIEFHHLIVDRTPTEMCIRISSICFISTVTVCGLFASMSVVLSAPQSSGEVAVLVGAGDIADCKDLSGAEATAKLLQGIPGTVMTIGDLAYPDGSQENFVCYDK